MAIEWNFEEDIQKIVRRKKNMKSAASLRAYREELMREAERNQLKQVHEEKDGKVRNYMQFKKLPLSCKKIARLFL